MATRYQDVGGQQPQQQFQGPEVVKSNRRLAEALMQAGMNPGPMSHWTQALGSVVQTGIGAIRHDMANRDEQEGRTSANRRLAEALATDDYSGAMSNPYAADKALELQVAAKNRGAGLADKRAHAEWEASQPAAQADLEYKRAQTEQLRSKANDPVEAYLLQRLRGGGPAGPAPMSDPATSGQNPSLDQQSYSGFSPAPQGGVTNISQQQNPEGQLPSAHQQFTPDVRPPGIINVADQNGPSMFGQNPQQQPTPEAMPQGGGQDMIETPYGRMSSEEARQLGGTMLLSPKYAPAGRALLDSLGADRGGLAKPSVNTLEERTINAAAQLGRLDNIEKKFNPAFLEIPKRLNMLGLSWSAKLGSQLGGKLSPGQAKELRDYAAFRSTSINNFNTILKELSGTAVSAQEFERIQNEQPTAGTGIFDGDDPVTFQSKMSTSKQLMRSAIARYNFMRSKGLNFNKDQLDQFMALDDVPGAIEKRGAEIEQQIRQRNPQIQQQRLDQDTRRQLQREFGV